jgi:hypothetical protein
MGWGRRERTCKKRGRQGSVIFYGGEGSLIFDGGREGGIVVLRGGRGEQDWGIDAPPLKGGDCTVNAEAHVWL